MILILIYQNIVFLYVNFLYDRNGKDCMIKKPKNVKGNGKFFTGNERITDFSPL